MLDQDVNKKWKKRFDNEFLKERQGELELVLFTHFQHTKQNIPLISRVLYCSSARSQNIIAFNVFFLFLFADNLAKIAMKKPGKEQRNAENGDLIPAVIF